VKTTPKGDKEGKNYDVRYLGQVFYMWSSTTWEVNWSYTGTFSSCMKGHGYAMRRTYVRKSSSMTLNEALPGRQPVSLCFYSFLKGNKEWNHPMMINLWLINLSFIFFTTTIMFMLIFIYLHALHFVIEVIFVSLHIHVLHLVSSLAL
jgi:hypothetical protein